MSSYPDGVAFVPLSKQAGQQKWQLEDEFIADVANGYHETNAQTDADAAFQLLIGGHSGGTKEYHMLKCVELAYEVRPV